MTPAQSWEEYSYPDYAFSVDFPAKPIVENTTYQVADNRSVPARVYSVRQNSSELKVTIADLANSGLDETAVIDHAIKTLSAGGDVTFNIPQRIESVYGRSVGIKGRRAGVTRGPRAGRDEICARYRGRGGTGFAIAP